KISQYAWKRDFWSKEMRNIVDDTRKMLVTNDREGSVETNLAILRNELEKQLLDVKGFKFKHIDALKLATVTPALLDSTEEAVNKLFEYYKANYKQVSRAQDGKHTRLSSTMEGRDSLKLLNNDHHNDRLEEFVTNRNDVKRIVTYNDELVQKEDLIYLPPKHKGFFKSHFYAPTKNFFGMQIPTFQANLLVIWGMTCLLALVLCFDGIRKLINGGGELAGRIGRKGSRVPNLEP
ncbi:MAG: hypothetical protein ACI87M_000891, partial [Yoonia sp.]